MEMQITFLGTSSGIPTKTRNHMAILLNYKDENILVDCGEGTQRQIRKADINPCKITRLLITHFHGDHTFGIPGIMHTLALNNYQKTLYIYGPSGTKEFIKKIFETFVQKEKINFEVKEVKGKFLDTKDFQITALPLEHNGNCNGYLFEEKNKIRIDRNKLRKLKIPNIPQMAELSKGKNIKFNGKIIRAKDLTYVQKGKKISFIFDTRVCENARKLAKNSDVVIAESTFLSDSENGDKLAKEYFHLTAKQAAQIAKKGKAKQLVLLHPSQRYEHKESLLLNEAKKIFSNTKFAEDFMKLDV